MITVFGRRSTCINFGGEKVFPEEVERELHSYPAIRDVLIVGRAYERWGEAVVAIVSLNKDSECPTPEQLTQYVRARLADYKRPKDYILAHEIRRSPAGKQDYIWAKAFARSAEETREIYG